MGLSAGLLLKLSKRYEPSAMVNFTFRGNDVVVQTDKQGNPLVMFIGRLGDNGRIKGQRYSRTLKVDPHGRVIKDHWDLKGYV